MDVPGPLSNTQPPPWESNPWSFEQVVSCCAHHQVPLGQPPCRRTSFNTLLIRSPWPFRLTTVWHGLQVVATVSKRLLRAPSRSPFPTVQTVERSRAGDDTDVALTKQQLSRASVAIMISFARHFSSSTVVNSGQISAASRRLTEPVALVPFRLNCVGCSC